MSELTQRTPQMIAIEINSIKDQTRKMVLSSSIEIGRRLVEAKEMIDHGQWGQWLSDNVDYSQRTANNLMRIFEEYGENQLALFDNSPNSQALANLSVTQAVALLGIAPDEREEFVEANHVEDLSTRELERIVKEKKELEKQMEKAAANAEERIKKLESAIKTTREDASRVAQELKAARAAGGESKVKKLTEDLKKAEQRAKDLDAELKEVREKPIEPAIVEVVPEETKRELEVLRAKATNDDSPLVTKFRLQFEGLTNSFQQLLQTLAEIKSVDAEIHEKYCGAIGKLIASMTGKLEA